MKKIAIPLFSILFFAVVFFFLWNFYPKNIGIFPGIVILYLLDIYLFWVYRNNILNGNRIKSTLLILLFWMPMLLILAMAVVSLFYPFDKWNSVFKTYYGGFILTGYVSKLIPLILVIVSDLIKVMRKLFGLNRRVSITEKFRIERSEFLKKAGILTGGILFGTLTFGMFKWIHDFKVRKKIVNLPHLPEPFSGFRIVQVSDIHLGSWLSKNELKEAVQIVNDLNPDVVFFTGDLVNYSTDEAYPFEDILKRIRGRFGVFSVLGNHDYGDYKRWNNPSRKLRNMDEMYSLHERLGWKLLRNSHEILEMENTQIAILGVENWGSMKRFQKYGDLNKAIQGAENVPVKLLLSHDPSHWEMKISHFEHSIDLTFAGHTHGAQFGIEIPGVRWSPSQYVYKYWAGLYTGINSSTNRNQYLYVNRGIGAIGYPGRVGILPEITLIELQS
jgi:predicted MPP superfamily phosphohydrolase